MQKGCLAGGFLFVFSITTPDIAKIFLVEPVVTMRLTAVELAAVATIDFIRKSVVRGIDPRDFARLRHHALYFPKDIIADNRFVILFDVVLRQLTPVGLLLLGKKINCIPLLQQGVAHVLFIR
jgi:hypothetical protein